MITIEDPPDVLACSTCMQPLDWVYRYRDGRVYAIVRTDASEDPSVVKLHTCPLPGVPKHPYRLDHQPREVWERGRRRARAVLAAAKAKKLAEES